MNRMITILGTASLLAGLAGAALSQEAEGRWRAELAPLNDSGTSGTATLSVSGDVLTIRVEAQGAAPGIMHLQHFHGFPTGTETAACPTGDADANGDGVVDLIETEPVAGTTMVPFDADPAGMDLLGGDFPVAGSDGSYGYEQDVPLTPLLEAFAEMFPDQGLDLDRRVVFLHGMPDDANLPDSAESLGGVPAHVTVPIACGALRAVEG